MWILLCGLALAGHKYDNATSDIVVEGDVARSQEELYAQLTDFASLARIFPSDCVEDWAMGEPHAGIGGTAMVTYHMAGMKRRLLGRITKAVPSYHVEIDHDGKKGFVTQIVLSEGPGGTTHVKLGTYIAAPPWPFKPYYFNKVRPAWQDCWERTVQAM